MVLSLTELIAPEIDGKTFHPIHDFFWFVFGYVMSFFFHDLKRVILSLIITEIMFFLLLIIVHKERTNFSLAYRLEINAIYLLGWLIGVFIMDREEHVKLV